MKVLLLDGEALHSLAAVRALGRLGHKVYVAAKAGWFTSAFRPLAMRSRYCANSRYRKSKDFCSDPVDLAEEFGVDCVMPLKAKTFEKMYDVSGFGSPDSPQIMLPPSSAFRLCMNKDLTAIWLKRWHHPIPETIAFNSAAIVCKPISSAGSVGLRYFRVKMDSEPHIFQEYIAGDSYGFFAIYRQGKLHSYFMHRRIRQYPITGGPSCCAESVYIPELYRLGKSVLDKFEWHGVAMVEFIKDSRTGEFKIIEINPKFWGSLDLAIHCGVNFPDLYCRLAVGENLTPMKSGEGQYPVGVRFRWLFPNDFMHLLCHYGFSRGFWVDFFNGTKTDIQFSDLNPNLLQPLYLFGLLKRYGWHWKYPNGRIPRKEKS